MTSTVNTPEENGEESATEQPQQANPDMPPTGEPPQKGFTTKEKMAIGGVAVVTAVGVGLVAPLAIIPALGYAGFTSAGVAAGSLAASIQTASTVAGSWFALCQSAGAVGAVAATTSAGVGVTAGAVAGGIAGGLTAFASRFFWRIRPNDSTNNGNGSNNDNDPPGSSQAEFIRGDPEETQHLIEQSEEPAQNNNRQVSTVLS